MATAAETPLNESLQTAWARLLRAHHALTVAIGGELKQAGFPPLDWYDALLALGRAPEGRLTPRELEQRMVLAQYNCSRLVDRLETEGLVRRIPFPGDRRRQLIEITEEGRALRLRMWPPYAQSIERHIGSKLNDADAARLAELLAPLLPDAGGSGAPVEEECGGAAESCGAADVVPSASAPRETDRSR
jgi:DNA-binding MarR family transcriptional regulator